MDKPNTLHSGQVAILKLLYKYRFGSRQLLAESLHIQAGSSLHERLQVLVKHGYIGMRFDKRLKLIGMPAAYYLTPKGIRALRAVPGHDTIDDSAVKAAYKDKKVGQDFITQTLNIYKYTNRLQHTYSGLKVFTKRELTRYSYFPPQLPDAFLSLPSTNPQQPSRFFLDVIPSSVPRYVIDRRIAAYATFFDEGGWDGTGSQWPAILLLAENGTTEKRLRHSVAAQLNRSDSELLIYTSTVSALAGETNIWTTIDDSDELVSLSDMS